LNLAHRHPAGVERQHLVVEAGETPLVFGDQARLKTPLAVARDIQRDRPVVSEHGFGTGPIAVVGVRLGFRPAGRISQMMGQLAAQRALDQRLLEPANCALQLLDGERSLLNKLVENLRGHRCQGCVTHQSLTTGSGHMSS
jgi:hypothetical protein